MSVTEPQVPRCRAPEPSFGIPSVYFDRYRQVHMSAPISGCCMRELGHKGDHMYETQEGQFLFTHSWPQETKRSRSRKSKNNPKSK